MVPSLRAIWYVAFPTYQYEEDVKALARKARLRIVDARFDNGDGSSDVPSLTLKPEYQPKGSSQIEPTAEAETLEKPRKRAYSKREPTTPAAPEGATDGDITKTAAE